MSEPFIRLRELIQSRSASVAVFGQSETGIKRLNSVIAGGFRGCVFDFSLVKAQQGNAVEITTPPPIPSAHPDVFDLTKEVARLAGVDILLVCFPVLLDAARSPDTSVIQRVSQIVTAQLRRGQLIVLESTAYPGMARELFQTSLENRGWSVGRDVFLACSPAVPDVSLSSFLKTCRIVGAIDPHSLELAKAFYESLNRVVISSSSMEAAEACPIVFDAAQGAVLALVHEFRSIFHEMGIEVREVLAIASRITGLNTIEALANRWNDPIPQASYFLSWSAHKSGRTARMIELIEEISGSMPSYLVERIDAALNEQSKPVKGSSILFLCAGGKEVGVRVTEIASVLLRAKGAIVSRADPRQLRLTTMTKALPTMRNPLNEDTLAAQDIVVIPEDLPDCDWQWVVRNSRYIVDCCNVTRDVGEHRERIMMI